MSDVPSEDNDTLLLQIQAEQMDALEIGQEGEVKCGFYPTETYQRLGEGAQGQSRALFCIKLGGKCRKFVDE